MCESSRTPSRAHTAPRRKGRCGRGGWSHTSVSLLGLNVSDTTGGYPLAPEPFEGLDQIVDDTIALSGVYDATKDEEVAVYVIGTRLADSVMHLPCSHGMTSYFGVHGSDGSEKSSLQESQARDRVSAAPAHIVAIVAGLARGMWLWVISVPTRCL